MPTNNLTEGSDIGQAGGQNGGVPVHRQTAKTLFMLPSYRQCNHELAPANKVQTLYGSHPGFLPGVCAVRVPLGYSRPGLVLLVRHILNNAYFFCAETRHSLFGEVGGNEVTSCKVGGHTCAIVLLTLLVTLGLTRRCRRYCEAALKSKWNPRSVCDT